jgi:uncharacterized protein YkwD
MHLVSLRVVLLAGALLASLAFGSTPAAHARPDGSSVRDANAIEAPLLSKINAARRSKGLPALRQAASLARAAAQRARAIGTQGFFSHSSANGTSPVTRIRRYYQGSTVGEVILWRSPDVTPAEALRMWLDSPSHRRLLLSSSFRDIGLAAVHAENGGRAYGGRPVTILVADLGSR